MIINIIFFLVFHFMADFCLQNSKLANEKANRFKYLIIHSVIYGVTLAIPILFSFKSLLAVLMLAIIVISHFFVDFLRIKLDKNNSNLKFHYYSFILDQIIHLVMIIIIVSYANYFNDNVIIINNFLIEQRINITFEQFIKIIFSIVFVTSPSSVFIKHTFNYLFPRKESENICADDNKANEINAGKIIGILERLIIVILGSLGLYTSIALVLTAKSIARYKTINDNPGFAEKYLVGTLLSLLMAIICLVIMYV